MAGGCCWRPTHHVASAFDGKTKTPLPQAHGIIPLQGFEDCTSPYNGEHRGQTAYLVGWRTTDERVFKSVDAKAAAAYAKLLEPRSRCVPVPMMQLCWAAVDALYASEVVGMPTG